MNDRRSKPAGGTRRRTMLAAVGGLGLLLVSGWASAAGEVMGPPAPGSEATIPLGPRAGVGPGTAPGTGPDTWADRIGPVLLPLGVVMGLVVVSALVVRKVARSGGGLASALGPGGRAPSGLIEVLGRYPVSRGQSLVLLKLDRRVLLLSHCAPGRHGSGGFTTLAEIGDPEEVASILLKVSEFEGRGAGGAFEAALRSAESSGDPWATATQPGREVRRGRDGDRAEMWRDDGHTLVNLAGEGPLGGAVRSLRERLAALRGRATSGEAR